MKNDPIPYPSEREQIRVAAETWRYWWRGRNTNNKKEVQDRLNALDGETATIEDIAAISREFPRAHMRSLVSPGECHQCEKVTYQLVTVGQPDDCESHTATLCEECLRAALKVIPK